MIISYLIEIGTLRIVGIEEELKVHYCKLSETYGSLSWRDLISKNCSNLGDAQGELLAFDLVDSTKVQEYSLCRLRSPISHVFAKRAYVRFEHGKEILRCAQDASTFGTFDLGEETGKLIQAQTLRFLFCSFFDELVCSEPSMAVCALGHRVLEVLDMSRGLKHTMWDDNRSRYFDELMRIEKEPTPAVLDLSFETSAEWA